MCMNLSTLLFLAGSVAEVHASPHVCALVLFYFGQEKTNGVEKNDLFHDSRSVLYQEKSSFIA